MPRDIKWYGWVPDLPDRRDLMFSSPTKITMRLPSKVDLRSKCPRIYNQAELGSCTSQAIAAAHEFAQNKQKKTNPFTPSRLFIYYNERVIEGTVDVDAGAMIRDGFKTINRQGAPPEDPYWPYDIAKFAELPPAEAYTQALPNRVITYQRVPQTLPQLKGCLAGGFPFVFGFSVYDSFESDAVARTGKVPMPRAGETLLGGHAVVAVGYDDTKKVFIVRNSWDIDWGMAGYFTMPYAYLTNPRLSSDFWTLRLVA